MLTNPPPPPLTACSSVCVAPCSAKFGLCPASSPESDELKRLDDWCSDVSLGYVSATVTHGGGEGGGGLRVLCFALPSLSSSILVVTLALLLSHTFTSAVLC